LNKESQEITSDDDSISSYVGDAACHLSVISNLKESERMSTNKPLSENSWILFPFVGLELINTIQNFKKPLYNDATIISRKDILIAAKNDNWSEKNIKSLKERIENESYKRYHSFIAIKRKLKTDGSNEYQILKNALLRAEDISAAIGLSFLLRSKHCTTKRLLEHNNCRQKSTIIIYEQSEKLVHFESGIDQVGPLKISIEDLHKFLFQPAFKSLNELLLNINQQEYKRSDEFKKTLTKASKIVSKAVNIEESNNPSATILACFTAIEILLGEEGTYKDLNNRLKVLNDANKDDYFEIDTIFKSRNNYVHRSIESTNKYSRLCVALALNTIHKVATYSNEFTNKLDLINYLDIIHKGVQLQSNLKWKEYMVNNLMQFKGIIKYRFVEEMKKADNTR